jgi:hypothetical protein
MTKENVFKTFLEDPIFAEKKHLTKDQINKIKFIDSSNDKLIEVIKIAISGNIDGEADGTISRKINQFLNK